MKSFRFFHLTFNCFIEGPSLKKVIKQKTKDINWFLMSVKNWVRGAIYECNNQHLKKLRYFYPYNNSFGGLCHCGQKLWFKQEKVIRGKDLLPMHEYYDHGLGMVVKGRTHRKQLIKQKKLVEVGNDWKNFKEETDKNRVARENKIESESHNEMMRELHYLESKGKI